MINLARPEVAVSPDDLDRDPMLLNLENGTVDLRTGERRDHARGDLITKQARVKFDPTADCPLWHRFLGRIMDGNARMIGFLQRLAGMCLTGDVRDQHLPIFFGPGNNGKSVYLDTSTGLMGDYAIQAPPDLLVIKRNAEHPCEIADLCGRRLVVSAESEEGARLKTAFVKRLTGDARLKGRFMRADFFEFSRTHKIVLVTNNRPQVREASIAIWRRLCAVPFTVVIPPEEVDELLLDKLRAEFSGILNWMLAGCREWLAEGLQIPPEVQAATEAYQKEQDVIKGFVDECCILAANAIVPRSDIYREYEAWAKRSGESHPLINRQFYERLRKLPGVGDDERRLDGKTTRLFTGIGLLSTRQEAPV
jgi:putative DNA primase/helicase